MKLLNSSEIHLVIAGWIAALVLILPSTAQAGCIITIAPENTEKNSESHDKDRIPELAGGPEELFGCSQTSYFRSTRDGPRRSSAVHNKRAPAGAYRSHAHTGPSVRDRDIGRSFGFRYPGFTRVYVNNRYTSSVRVYRGSVYSGSTRTYSGPRFTNSTTTLRPRYAGSSRTYRGRRYTGFQSTYRGPRYPGDITTTRRTRW